MESEYDFTNFLCSIIYRDHQAIFDQESDKNIGFSDFYTSESCGKLTSDFAILHDKPNIVFMIESST